jgi:hypothetical protein
MTTHRQLWLGAGLLATTMLSSRAARAEFVVVDVSYTHSAQTTTDSHYRVQPPVGTPSNWKSPIDYSAGEAWVRLEVKTKPPGDTPTRFQVCFELAVNYACTDQAPTYTKPGVYTWGTPFSNFYLGGPVDWSKGIRDTALILKDTNNVKPAPENVGDAVSARYMPTDLHVTVTLVPKGETYVPPAPGDGGGADATADHAQPASDDAATIEASAPPDEPQIPDTGTSDLGSPVSAPPAPASIDHDAGSSSSATEAKPANDMQAGCTCSQRRSRSVAGFPWVLVLPVAAALRRGRTRCSHRRAS